MRNQRKHEVLISMMVACGIAACKADAVGSGAQACSPGAVASCGCAGNPALTTTCRPDGTGYQPCVCDAGSAAGQGGSASTLPGTSGQPAVGSGGIMAAPPGNAGSSSPSTAGRSGSPGGSAGMTVAGHSGGAGMNAADAGGASGTTGASGSGSTSDTDMLRNVCVAEINMYRAMLTGVMPLKRASAAQEMCSDMGAQSDGDSMAAHGFFQMPGSCIQTVGLSAQDTCPGYPVGGFGAATVADALKACLKGMWAEGEPPNGRAACMADSTCFAKYGHYLNMSNPKATAASCAFYKMKDGMSWWMNQDFVVTWP